MPYLELLYWGFQARTARPAEIEKRRRHYPVAFGLWGRYMIGSDTRVRSDGLLLDIGRLKRQHLRIISVMLLRQTRIPPPGKMDVAKPVFLSDFGLL